MSNFRVYLQEKVSSINCAQAMWGLCLAEIIKFYDKMNLPTQMRINYKLKHCYTICVKFGDQFWTFLNKLML